MISFSFLSFQFLSFVTRVLWVLCSECTWYYCVSRDRVTLVRRLSRRLSNLNILAVKVFQALTDNFIDQSMNNELIEYTDQAPWKEDDIDYDSLSAITHKYNITLLDGYKKPINAGMISLVFKGYQRTKPVVIKIKRRHIEDRLNRDIANLLILVQIFSIFPFIKNCQVADIIHRNIFLIRKQTDFLQEVDNMNRMRNKCNHLKYVHIPQAERQITENNPNVIVMEYMQGLKIDQVDESDYEGFAKQVVKFGVVSIALHGVVHGDLHCGNILFMKDAVDAKYPYKIAILDFGIVYEIADEFRETLFELFTHLFEDSPRTTAQKLLNSHGIIEPSDIFQQIPSSDYMYILSIMETTITEIMASSKVANQALIYHLIDSLCSYIKENPQFAKWGIRPSDDLVKTQLMIAMTHGVTMRLCHGEFIPLLNKVIQEMFPFLTPLACTFEPIFPFAPHSPE